MSDNIDVAPANYFPMSSDMGSSDILAFWCLKQHGPWVIWICHLMTFNRRKYHLSCNKATWFSSTVTRRTVVHLTDLAIHLAVSWGRSSLIFKRHDFFFSRMMDLGLLLVQMVGMLIWLGVMAPALMLVSTFRSFFFLF